MMRFDAFWATIQAKGSPLFRRNHLPQRPLVVVATALGIGCVCGPTVGGMAPSASALTWAGAGLFFVSWALLFWRGAARAAGWALLGAVVLAGASWSIARVDVFASDDLAWQLDDVPRPLAIRGKIIGAPRTLPHEGGGEQRDDAICPTSLCEVDVTSARWGSHWRAASGEARVLVAGASIDLPVETEVEVMGRGLRPTGPLNPGEPDMARRARELRRLSIVRVKGWECVRVIRNPDSWSLPSAIDRLRTRASAVLADRIAPERTELAAALLLGLRDGLETQVSETFMVTGTIHVLAISGLHVGLLAIGLFTVCRCLGVLRPRAGLIVGTAIGGYMLLVGAGTPVVRATILVWIACGALALGRRPATINSLALAAIVVCLWRPADVFSAGAQLSFLSTGVLTGVANMVRGPRDDDPIERLIERSRSWWEKFGRNAMAWTAGAFLASAAVWLATTPLVAHRFHVVSLVGLAVNVVVAAIVPLAMVFGFLCLLAAPVSGVLSGWFGAGCDGALATLQAIVSMAANVPGGHAWVAGPSAWWVAGWFVTMMAALVLLRVVVLKRAATWAILAVTWSVIGIIEAVVTSSVQEPGLRMVMAAVGHGCGIVVRTPCGRCLVYDAGRLGAPAAARRSIESVLWSERITRIDTLVISHADTDHFNAVPALLTRFSVGELVVPGPLLASRSMSVAELLTAVRRQGIPIRSAKAGDSFAIDPLCRARVLHPSPREDSVFRSNNESSLVLSIESAGRRVLLSGDLEGQALQAFNRSTPGACDVVVAPHHGSRTSLPADIAAVTTPHVVLASGRGGQHWPEVRAAYAKAARRSADAVLNTGGEGAIAVQLTAAGIGIERFAAGRWRSVSIETDQADDASACLVNKPAAIKSTSWLATYVPRIVSTSLLRP